MSFNWKHPDYAPVWNKRAKMLEWLRTHPEDMDEVRRHYAAFPADFINDWAVTYDPRNADVGLPTIIPFLLFPRQRELIAYILDRWKNRRPGLVEKSRDAGASYIAVDLACTLCLFHGPISIGFGSRKEEYVDKTADPKSLFWKARLFMENLPAEFTGGWEPWHAPHMRIRFPNGSIISGEAGDSIGRGDRTTIHFVDEAAHLDRPESVDMALSQTTNCRIDISSVNGMNNPFAQKRWGGKIETFVFDWRDDPRKDEAWYEKMCQDHDPVVVAQEIDRDYSASVHGIVIPGIWVRAAIDAREKLRLPLTGQVTFALDIADEGIDKNAIVGGQGVDLTVLEEWSGKGSDTFHTVQRAFELCDEHGVSLLTYDADGMGALVRGDARVINEQRAANNAPAVHARAFRGSEAVHDPDGVVEGTIGGEGRGRTNKDYFANRKAQGWWALRKRFQRTYRWINDGIKCDPDEIVSISSKAKNYQKLVTELSQPTYKQNATGKMLIDKKPDGMKSPNLADGCMMRYAPNDPLPMEITAADIAIIRASGFARRRRAY